MTCGPSTAAALAFLLAFGIRDSRAAAAGGGLDAWIPEAAVAVLEVVKPGPVLDRVLEVSRANRAPGSQDPGWTNLVRFLENRFRSTGEALLRRVVRDGAVLAVGPGGAFAAVARSGDAPMLHEMNDAILGVARLDATQKDAPDPVAEGTHQGVRYWSLGGKEFHAIIDDCLVLANRLEVLKAVLDVRAGAGRAAVTALADYRAARAPAGPDTVARLALSPAALAFLMTRNQATTNAPPDPMAELLFAGYRDAVAADRWLSADLSARGRSLALHVTAGAKPPAPGAPTAFAWPPDPADGACPFPPVPGQIASVSLFRNLRDFYAAKDALFPERTSQLIFFENMMGIFFTGRDLADDVMGAVAPHLRLVVAEPAFDPAIGTPAVKVPALALVFRMRDPSRFAPVMEEAWQKALGMINFTRGQQAQPGLIIDRLDHGRVRYTCAAFSAREEADRTKLDTRFNFRPSIACAGEHLILGSTDSIVNALIDAAGAPSPPPIPGANSLVEFDGVRVAAALEANREYLVRQNMVKKGQDHAKASQEMTSLIALLRGLGNVSLRTGVRDGHVTLDLSSDPGLAPAAVAGGASGGEGS